MNIWLAVVGTVMLVLFSATSYYIGIRLDQIARAYLPNPVCRFFSVVIFIVSVILALRFILLFGSGRTALKQLVNGISSYYMGIYFYLLLFFGMADLLLWLGRLTGHITSPIPAAVRVYANLAALCISVGMAGYGIWHAEQIGHSSYKVRISEQGDMEELQIALISDLHLGAVTSERKLGNIVDEIRKLDPDIVCIAGDLFDSDFETIKNPEKAAAELRRLTAEYDVYCCLGNHDAGVTFPQMEAFLKKCNIRCLNEEYVTIGNRIRLLGRADSAPMGDHGDYIRTDTGELLASGNSALPVVVLDHNPGNRPDYTAKAELLLCGHTHHGQIWPVNLVTAYGYYPMKKGMPQMIVTSGVGVWGMPMRIASGCEIVSIRLY